MITVKNGIITVKLELDTFEYGTLITLLEEEIDRNKGAGYEYADEACKEILEQLKSN